MTKGADRESILQGFEPNCYGDGNVYRGMRSRDSEAKIIYTESKKEWVGLTDKEMMQCYDDVDWDSDQDVWLDFGENVQAKLKEKNT
jgi:hypothetical protein